MKTERASKLLLGLEALVLAYPTGLGLLMMAGAIAPAATGSLTFEHTIDAVAGIATVAGLLCGWWLVLTFMLRGRAAARGVSRWWWIVATFVAVLAVAISALYEASRVATTHGNNTFAPVGSTIGLLGYGILFVPSYLHLSAEVWLRAR